MKKEDADSNASVSSNPPNEQDEMLRLLNDQLARQFGQSLPLDLGSKGSVNTCRVAADKAEKNADPTESRAEVSFFRLFNTVPSSSAGEESEQLSDLPRVRLQSPTELVLTQGRSLNRILAVEDEDKGKVKQRRKDIKAAAVDAEWVMRTSASKYWSPHPQPSRKITSVPLRAPSHTRLPLPPIGIAYFPSPKSSKTSLKVRQDVSDHGKVKMKIYPDLGKQRVEDRLAKIARRRMALALSQAQNATVMKEEKIKKRVEKKRKDDDVEGKKKRVKRQSKKKRLHIKGAQAG